MDDSISIKTSSFRHLLTSKKKDIKFTSIEKEHSSLLNLQIELNGNLNHHDAQLFQKLLHAPNTYSNLSEKKYSKALSLAMHFKAPILYAELLSNKLPPAALLLITHNYSRIRKLVNTLFYRIQLIKVQVFF